MYVPRESEHTCPVRSISRQVLIDVTRGFWQIKVMLLVKSHSCIAGKEKDAASMKYHCESCK